MPSLEDGLYHYLRAQPEVTALIGGAGNAARVFPIVLPQTVGEKDLSSAMPAITFRRQSIEFAPDGRTYTASAADGIFTAHVLIECWGASYKQAKDVAEAVYDALHGKRNFALGSFGVASAWLTESEDQYEDEIRLFWIQNQYEFVACKSD